MFMFYTLSYTNIQYSLTLLLNVYDIVQMKPLTVTLSLIIKDLVFIKRFSIIMKVLHTTLVREANLTVVYKKGN